MGVSSVFLVVSRADFFGAGRPGGSLGSICCGALMNQEPGPLHRGSDAQRLQWSAGGGPHGLCRDGTRARRPRLPSACSSCLVVPGGPGMRVCLFNSSSIHDLRWWQSGFGPYDLSPHWTY
jgi:hypothetical protein